MITYPPRVFDRRTHDSRCVWLVVQQRAAAHSKWKGGMAGRTARQPARSTDPLPPIRAGGVYVITTRLRGARLADARGGRAVQRCAARVPCGLQLWRRT
eukprot:scaffold1908_cov104-Isochrysis_galbana.AAC.13